MPPIIVVTISPIEDGILCQFAIPVSPDEGSLPDSHKRQHVRFRVEGFGPDIDPTIKAHDVLGTVLLVVAESLSHFHDMEKHKLTWEQMERLGVAWPK